MLQEAVKKGNTLTDNKIVNILKLVNEFLVEP